mgnify:CR=1 FL=1
MDYSALAAELLSFRTALHHLPAIRGLDEMSGGEYFVLSASHSSHDTARNILSCISCCATAERQGRPS